MRMLIDECLPRQLKQWLLLGEPRWEVCTVQEAGWTSMKNGELLRIANSLYSVFITADKNMYYQHSSIALQA